MVVTTTLVSFVGYGIDVLEVLLFFNISLTPKDADSQAGRVASPSLNSSILKQGKVTSNHLELTGVT